jgi:hypothetical protein
VFGELNGQAGEGMAVDGAGRVHLFTQIRWPMGIYHAVWDQDHWTEPSLIYLIRYSSDDLAGDNISAHNTVPVIRAGNQVVLTLADEPSAPDRRLFVMENVLLDVPATTSEPTPTATAMPTVEATSTPVAPTATPAPSFRAGGLPPGGLPRPDSPLWIGLGPVLSLVVGITLLRMFLKLKQ